MNRPQQRGATPTYSVTEAVAPPIESPVVVAAVTLGFHLALEAAPVPVQMMPLFFS